MKYKRLGEDELQHLEKEFVNFLAAAQVTGPDWEKMKAQELEKAEELIDVFSDLVYEKVMSKMKFLEFRDEKTLNIFNCQEDKILLIGLRVKEHSDLNFTDTTIFNNWDERTMADLHLVKSEKTYVGERGVEVFELLQNGCFITDEKLYTLLSELT